MANVSASQAYVAEYCNFERLIVCIIRLASSSLQALLSLNVEKRYVC